MAEPSIAFEGAEIPDFSERQLARSVIEVTPSRNLRLAACVFFRGSI